MMKLLLVVNICRLKTMSPFIGSRETHLMVVYRKIDPMNYLLSLL